MTIEELKKLQETEDTVEFKEAKGGNFSYNGGNKAAPKERRRCILGYVTAFANEGGGYLVFGMKDAHPHEVVGTNQNIDRVGELKQNIYRDTGIRIDGFELFEKGNRVLVIKIPGRPIGKVYKFEDVPLMRVGEELLLMSEDKYRAIINENEPDFSVKICKGLSLDDLDSIAIEKMKSAYSKKQNNTHILTESNRQILTDLGLMIENDITYAALILLGKTESIRQNLPQSEIRLEYRSQPWKIVFDNRVIYLKAYFILIEELWETIDLRNGKIPIQEGPYIFDIPFFNKEVIREAVNNAIAHRDYQRASEIVVKQNPQELNVISPGGFPLGVSVENILDVSSTPRNRLLADVLSKTGAVERSGQGIDKMFYQCLTEAKAPPDYSATDDFQVDLKISALVKDKAFALFIRDYQEKRKDEDKLSVHEIITLDKIRLGIPKIELSESCLQSLFDKGLIIKIGQTRNMQYRLSAVYYSFIGKEGKYTKDSPIDIIQMQVKLVAHLSKFKVAKMGDFVDIFESELSREQVKNIIYKFVEKGFLDKIGTGSGTKYKLGTQFEKGAKFIDRAMKLGIDEMKKRGELPEELEN